MDGTTRTVAIISMVVVGLALGACGQSDDATTIEDDNDGFNVNQDDNDDDQQDDRASGAACETDEQCGSDNCLTGEDWPDGFCTYVGCSDDGDCTDGACMTNPQGDDFCTRDCDVGESDQCRDDYTCLPTPDEEGGWCSPHDDDDRDEHDLTGVDIECQPVDSPETEFTYEIDEDTDSYMVVPFSPNNSLISPQAISTPDGQFIDFEAENSFQVAGAQLFGVINPTMIPATPEFEDQLATGEHTYHVEVDGDEICYYTIQDSGPSTTLNLNIYPVGLSGIDADNAATNANIQQLLNEADAIFQQAGVELGDIRFFDVPDDVEDDYRIIRERGDVSSLVSYSQPPGDTDEDAVSANVFITEQFAMSGGSGALGVSLGIPGAAGLHGSGLSGVAMTGQQIGQSGGGNKFSANIMAHELGHFLGLFHTSEQGGQTVDPLQDTPTCSDLTNPTGCPDWGNLMFPMADSDNDELTDDQSHVISVNPLTQ